VFLFSVG